MNQIDAYNMNKAEIERIENILKEEFPLKSGPTKPFTLGMLRKRLNEDLKDMPDDTIILTHHVADSYRPIEAAFGTLVIPYLDSFNHKRYFDAIKENRRSEGINAICIG